MQKRSSRKNFQARLEEMIECLRDEIRNGALTVGSFLPSEKDLEKRFKLGNSSIRKGLAVLVSEGWIEKIPRVGNRVINIGSEEKTIIKFGYSSRFPQLIELEQIIEKFHQEYPTIHVQLLELPLSEYSFSLKSYLEAGVLDVVMLSNNNFQYFIDTSNTEMLENVSMNEEMFPFLNQAFQHEGCLLAQPFIFSPVILCYNREHFRQAEVSEPDSSWTWHDLLNAAQQVAMKNHTYGFYYHLPSRNRWPIFMLQSGMKLVPDEHGKYKVKGTKLVEGLTICRDMILNPDVFPILITENEADVEALFLEEKVSVIMTTYFYLNAFKDSGLTFDCVANPYLRKLGYIVNYYWFSD
ncbi:extracellular solute-binding protein [Caldalkalibacillus mannanilyticus]|uniref:extracellular solute-binding protein n=1 Tax=Caldalkalibacillus mannanilyticus TaxID=1418 RepID=UPI00068476B9|nr:extracellular solute-binding protein [Caldalkalibacillus mannanilyticus]